MRQDKDKYFFKVSVDPREFELLSDTSFTYLEKGKMVIDTYSEEKGHWLGADGWNIRRYATFDYSQRHETPK